MCFKDHCNGADYERQTLWNDGPYLKLQWAYWGESVSMTMTRQYRVIEGYEWVLCHCPDRRGHPAYVAAVLCDKVTQRQSKWTWRSHCHTHTLSLRRCSMEHTASIFMGQRKIVLPSRMCIIHSSSPGLRMQLQVGLISCAAVTRGKMPLPLLVEYIESR